MRPLAGGLCTSERVFCVPPGYFMNTSLSRRTVGLLLFAAAVNATAQPSTGSLSLEQKEEFLQNAEIQNVTELSEGTTRSLRATLSDGRTTHDVHIQTIDVAKPLFRGKDGTIEKNFRDTFRHNIAAYRLAKILGLGYMVPPSVERPYQGKPASFTWWADQIQMTEMDRRDKGIKPPASQFWVDQLNIVRVFDQLIYNMDRNQGNLLITHDWKVVMIDHTRAFRVHPTLKDPAALSRIDHNLLPALKRLNRTALTRELAPYLKPEEITALLTRRDVIVGFFETEIKKKGQELVLTGMPRKTPVASIP